MKILRMGKARGQVRGVYSLDCIFLAEQATNFHQCSAEGASSNRLIIHYGK